LKRAEFAEVLSKPGVKFKISARILKQKSTCISLMLFALRKIRRQVTACAGFSITVLGSHG